MADAPVPRVSSSSACVASLRGSTTGDASLDAIAAKYQAVADAEADQLFADAERRWLHRLREVGIDGRCD